MRQFIAFAREVFVKVNLCALSQMKTPLAALLVISLSVAGCGGQLGTIKPPEVESALAQATSAIEKARAADAPHARTRCV